MAVLVHSRVKSVNLWKCHFPKRGAKPQTCPVCGAVGSQLPMTLRGSGNNANFQNYAEYQPYSSSRRGAAKGVRLFCDWEKTEAWWEEGRSLLQVKLCCVGHKGRDQQRWDLFFSYLDQLQSGVNQLKSGVKAKLAVISIRPVFFVFHPVTPLCNQRCRKIHRKSF